MPHALNRSPLRRSGRPSALLGLLLLWLYLSPALADYVYWTPVNPMPSAGRFEDVLWNGARFVTVGKNGLVAISSTAAGDSWEIQDSGSISNLYGIAWNGSNRYVAVGQDGIILTSSDARSWSVPPAVTDRTLRGVLWDGTRFLAYGSAETIAQATLLSSSDGQAWSQVTLDSAGASIHDLASDGVGHLLGVGTSGLVLINDGSGWLRYQLPPTSFGLSQVVFWSAALDPGGNGDFVIGGDGGLIVKGNIATDPSAWSFTTTAQGKTVQGLRWDGSHLLAVDTAGLIYDSGDSGLSWTARASAGQPLENIVGDNPLSRYIAVGSTVTLSLDPATWGATPGSAALTANLNAISGATDGSQRFVSAGANAAATVGSIYRDLRDGSGWQAAVSVPAVAGLYASHWDGDNARFLVGGANETILYSGDADTWLAATTPGGTSILRDLTHNGMNNHVAVGDGGTTLHSTDGGQTWTYTADSGTVTTNNLNAVSHNSTRFVAIGDASTLLVSNLGDSWSSITLNLANLPNLNDIVWSAPLDLFVAVGDGGTVLTSPDGNLWDIRNSTTLSDLGGVTWGNGQFIATGSSSRILLSADGIVWREMLVDSNNTFWASFFNQPVPSLDDTLRAVAWNGRRFATVADGGFTLYSTGADLRLISLTDSVIGSPTDKAAYYDDILYTLALDNFGDFNTLTGATNTLTVTLPNALAYLSSTTPASVTSCTEPALPSDHTLTCTLPSSILSQEQLVFTVKATVNADIAAGTLAYLTTTAGIATDSLEANHTNNLASVETTQWSLEDKFIYQENQRVVNDGAGASGPALLALLLPLLGLRHRSRYGRGPA